MTLSCVLAARASVSLGLTRGGGPEGDPCEAAWLPCFMWGAWGTLRGLCRHDLSGSSYLQGENGSPLQYSCRENPMDRRAWLAAVHGVTELDMTERLSTHLQGERVPPSLPRIGPRCPARISGPSHSAHVCPCPSHLFSLRGPLHFRSLPNLCHPSRPGIPTEQTPAM